MVSFLVVIDPVINAGSSSVSETILERFLDNLNRHSFGGQHKNRKYRQSMYGELKLEVLYTCMTSKENNIFLHKNSDEHRTGIRLNLP